MKKKSGITFENAPKVLTSEMVQELLHISPTTFFRLASGGKLPGAFKLGRLWRIDRDKLRTWIESQAQN